MEKVKKKKKIFLGKITYFFRKNEYRMYSIIIC